MGINISKGKAQNDSIDITQPKAVATYLVQMSSPVAQIGYLKTIARQLRLKKPSLAMQYCTEGLVLLQQLHNVENKNYLNADLLLTRADIYLGGGSYDTALVEVQKLKKIFPLDDMQQVWAGAIEGDVYGYQEVYEKASNAYFQALKILDKQDDLSLRSRIYNGMGTVYHVQADRPMAAKYYKKALDIRQERKEWSRMAPLYNNLGVLFRQEEQYDSAKYYYLEGIRVRQMIKDTAGIGGILNNLGAMYYFLGKYDTAITYYHDARELGVQSRDTSDIFTAELNLGGTYIKLEEYAKAKKYLEQAAISAEGNTHDVNEERLKYIYSVFYEKQGDYKNAYAKLKDYIIYYQKIKKRETRELTKDMEAKYENTKKEQEITILKQKRELQAATLQKKDLEITVQKKLRNWLILGTVLLLGLIGIIWTFYKKQQHINALLEEQKKAIEAQNKEKEVLLKEVHHRVKNNLQIISSLLNIQSRRIDHAPSKAAFKEIRNRIKSIALIHQKLYMNDDIANIDVVTYIQELVRNIMRSYSGQGKQLELDFDLKPLQLSLTTAVSLGLIVNELVSNCFKYAFVDAQKGKITISLDVVEGNKYLLSVADNGQGVDADILEQKRRSYGLSMILSLAKKMNGMFRLGPTKIGTLAEVEFENIEQNA
ncbi:MAG: tetratricopeptide repeat protein [Aureispira sp.]|nr:tetratricopeptide repeat protein [Aureispira sp.]